MTLETSPKARVLIVDDNAPFRHLMGAFLKKNGHTIIEAKDGQEALAIIPQENPDIILLDLQMQPLGGFEFMREYNELTHNIPVVLITGDESLDILNHATKLGFVSVLKKPVTEERITQIIQRFTNSF